MPQGLDNLAYPVIMNIPNNRVFYVYSECTFDAVTCYVRMGLKLHAHGVAACYGDTVHFMQKAPASKSFCLAKAFIELLGEIELVVRPTVFVMRYAVMKGIKDVIGGDTVLHSSFGCAKAELEPLLEVHRADLRCCTQGAHLYAVTHWEDTPVF